MHPFKILELPPEIVGEICEHLEDTDLLHVRSVCKALEGRSSTAFGKRFFEHLVAILHPTSLVTLLEIARHRVLSKFVRSVTISGELIGQSIRSLDNDVERHVGMQRSIANSGLDVMILVEAFRALQSIQVVSIDISSFSNAENFGFDENTVKCGRAHMHICPEEGGDDRGPGYGPGYNRIYEVVLKALDQARRYENLSLQLRFCGMDNSDETVSFFDLGSAEWVKFFSSTVREIRYLGCMDRNWVSNLLRATVDVRNLDLSGHEGVLSLPIYTVGVSHWPRLRRLYFNELYLRHREFTHFLHQHCDTLEDLHMQGIGFVVDGTWTEPLEIISNMARLDCLFLNQLLESTTYRNSNRSFMEYEDPDVSRSYRKLQSWNPEDIETAMHALHSDLRTKPLGMHYSFAESTADETCFYQVVDLRKAVAAIEGRIVWIDGEWVKFEMAGSGYE